MKSTPYSYHTFYSANPYLTSMYDHDTTSTGSLSYRYRSYITFETPLDTTTGRAAGTTHKASAMKSPFSAGSESPIDCEDTLLKPYFGSENNKAVILKLLQDSQLIAGYNLLSSSDETIQKTLALFSYGTLADYEANASSFLPLGEPQISQLRRLTVLQVLQNFNRDGQMTIPYAAFPSCDDLELQIAHLVGTGVISARLSQRESTVHLKEIHRPRDIQPGAHDLLQPVQSLLQRLSSVQQELEKTMNQVVNEQRMAEASAASANKSHASSTDPMDIDFGSNSPFRHKKRRGAEQLFDL